MNIHYAKHTLPNGLRVITAPMHDTKAVTILIMVGAGSRYEEKRTNGVAHFLEHMFFKGTEHRPSTTDIARELDTLGADYNAFTSEESTGFYVRVAGDDFSQAFDIITDMLTSPLFVEDEIEREKGVIVEELNMYEDTPMRSIYDQAKLLFYGDTPLGRNIGGAKDIVSKFTRKDFIEFREKYYRPDNIVVVIAGAGSEEHWNKEVKEKLGPMQGKAHSHFERADLTQTKPRVRLGTKKTDQAHLLVGFHTFPRTDPRWYALRVLQTILGGGMSSRLFLEVRERRGLAYYVRAGSWEHRDAGALVASAGVKVDKIDEAIGVITDEFRSLRDVLVTEEELVRSQKNLRGSLYLGLEDSMAIASSLVEQELFWGEIEQPEQIVAKWNAVTREEMLSIAKECITPEKLNMTIIGPFDAASRFEKLANL